MGAHVPATRIFRAKVKGPSNDKGPHKQVRIEADDDEFSVQVWEPYGVQGAPMTDGDVVVFVPDGDMAQAFAIVMPPPKDRVDQQAEGETTFKNHKAGQTIKHDKDGTTTHEAPGDIILKSGGIVHINP